MKPAVCFKKKNTLRAPPSHAHTVLSPALSDQAKLVLASAPQNSWVWSGQSVACLEIPQQAQPTSQQTPTRPPHVRSPVHLPAHFNLLSLYPGSASGSRLGSVLSGFKHLISHLPPSKDVSSYFEPRRFRSCRDWLITLDLYQTATSLWTLTLCFNRRFL